MALGWQQSQRFYDNNFDLGQAIDRLTDYCKLLAHYADYFATQSNVDDLYRQPAERTRQCILNVAGTGMFSSDRRITEYTGEIWVVKPLLWAIA